MTAERRNNIAASFVRKLSTLNEILLWFPVGTNAYGPLPFMDRSDVPSFKSAEVLHAAEYRPTSSEQVVEKAGLNTKDSASYGPAVQYVLDELIGHGSFGTVYGATAEDGQLYAVKLVTFVHDDRPNKAHQRLEDLRDRLTVILSLKNNHVVRYHTIGIRPASESHPEALLIAMELMHGGTLEQLLQEKRTSGQLLSLKEVRDYTRQLLRGLAYLHRNKITLTDFKPGDVLIDTREPLTWKLCISSVDSAVAQKGDAATVRKFRAKPAYMSPEIALLFDGRSVTTNPVGSKANIWSLGCVVAGMVRPSQELIFTNGHSELALTTETDRFKLAEFIRNGGRPKLPAVLDPNLRQFIEACWTFDAKKRPPAHQLLALAFVSPVPLVDTSVGENQQHDNTPFTINRGCEHRFVTTQESDIQLLAVSSTIGSDPEAMLALTQLAHANVQTYVRFVHQPRFQLVYAVDKDVMPLRRLLDDPCVLTQNDINYVAARVLDGLNYLHYTCHFSLRGFYGKGFYHGNLSPETIVVSLDNSIVKLTDMHLTHAVRQAPLKTFEEFRQHSYSVMFSSPEKFASDLEVEQRALSPSTDVWSFGCVLLSLITQGKELVLQPGGLTSKDWLPTIISARLNGATVAIPKDVPCKYADIISLCLTQRKENRPVVSSIVLDFERLSDEFRGSTSSQTSCSMSSF